MNVKKGKKKKKKKHKKNTQKKQPRWHPISKQEMGRLNGGVVLYKKGLSTVVDCRLTSPHDVRLITLQSKMID